MKLNLSRLLILAGLSLFSAGAALGHEPPYTSDFERERCTFVSSGSNLYLPLWPGAGLRLKGTETDADGDMVEITSIHTVLPETELIDGLVTRVVEHRELEDDELIEVSRDFMAICRETGAVWYFGEDVDIYEDGKVVSHEGGWRAGVDGAKPGLLMPGTPVAGARYHQENAPGVAEDRGEIVGIHAEMTVPAGTFQQVLEIVDTNPLHPGEADTKFYAPGVGLIQDEVEKLVEIIPAPCRPDSTTLCLSNGRFRVQAQWKDFEGREGSGTAAPQSDESGTFWFFASSNTEVLVKVLDGCSLPGFGNFWVFAAGLTNVDVILTVTDTRTPAVKTYRNPLGTPFEAVLDTAAFTGCP